MGGTFQGQFQIPNNPGQPTLFGPAAGNTLLPIAGLSNYQFGRSHRASGRRKLLRDSLLSPLRRGFRPSRCRGSPNTELSISTRMPWATSSSTALPKTRFGKALPTASKSTAAIISGPTTPCGSARSFRPKRLRQTPRRRCFPSQPVTRSVILFPAAAPARAWLPMATFRNQSPSTSPRPGWLYSIYAQDEWKVLPKVTVNYGARFDVVNEYTMENQISPRLNTVWKPTDATTVHAGYANYFTPPPFELVSTTALPVPRFSPRAAAARRRDPARPIPAPAPTRPSNPNGHRSSTWE